MPSLLVFICYNLCMEPLRYEHGGQGALTQLTWCRSQSLPRIQYKGESKLLIDRWVGPGYDQKGKIKDYKWNAKIFTGLNYAVSLHLCDEVGRDFPNDGLGKEYDFTGLVLPVGSSATVTLIFTGASDENVWLGFHQDGSQFVGHQYDRVGLNRREEFTVLVRNAKGRWLLATSFVQSGFISVPRQNQHEKLNLVSSDNCTIKRILAVCGPVPYRYRPK